MEVKDLDSIVHKIIYAKVDVRKKLFNELDTKDKAILLFKLSNHIKSDLLNSISNKEVIQILEHLDPDDATDIVQLLKKNRVKIIIDKLSDNLKKSVTILSKFDPKTAAGLMNLDYVQVDIKSKFSNVAEKVKIHEIRTGKMPVIIVTAKNKIIGYLPEYQLAMFSKSELIEKHIKRIATIKSSAKYKSIVKLFEENTHSKIVVVGVNKEVTGIIYADDVIKLIKSRKGLELYGFAGVQDEETVYYSASEKVKSRYKWLIFNLATAFLASFVVRFFDQTISKYVLLAVYMPIVAGMGGNAGTQTLAIIIRGITLNQINFKNVWGFLKEELLAGFANGLINALFVFIIVIVVNHDVKIAFILGISMVGNLLVSSFFGTLVPLVMKKLGRDPASSATVLITTATDVLGFFIFLGLATIILV